MSEKGGLGLGGLVVPALLVGTAAFLILGGEGKAKADSGGGGGGGSPPTPDPSTPDLSKVPSPKDYQWYWTVKEGQNPSLIAKLVTGNDRRYMELIAANPEKATVGDPKNPYSTGYNFKSLIAGEKLKVPLLWNEFISADGSSLATGKPFA